MDHIPRPYRKKIFSKKGSGRGVKYFLERPYQFKREVKASLISLLKNPTSIALPPLHRQKERNAQANLILQVLQDNEKKVALIFSSPFVISPSERYRQAKIMQYRAAPIFMSGSSLILEHLEIKLGLKRIKIGNHIVGNGLYYPDDPSLADLIYFESEAMGTIVQYFCEKPNSMSSHSLVAELNQLILEEFPIRGLEAAERLAEIIGGNGGK
ncbi:MAG: hypothetical protein ACOH5I_01655 [Oligoflexus sp.]